MRRNPNRIVWLNRIPHGGPYSGYFPSEAAWEPHLRRMTDVKDMRYIQKGGTCFELTKPNHSMFVIALNMKEAAKRSTAEVAAMLVHEVMHAWQGILRWMGEKALVPP